MCFWIFHDWRKRKAWGEILTMFGYECAVCGKRKLEGDGIGSVWNYALDWEKEEVLR